MGVINMVDKAIILEELAMEYAEDMCPKEDYLIEEEYTNDLIINFDDAKAVLEWLESKYNITLTPKN